MTDPLLPLDKIIAGELRIVTAGIDLLDRALQDQGQSPTSINWRPPVDDSVTESHWPPSP